MLTLESEHGRYYCRFCNTWVAPNKISIQNHLNGSRHKYNYNKYLQEVEKQEIIKEKKEKQITQELIYIDKVAEAQFKLDQQGKVFEASPHIGVTPDFTKIEINKTPEHVNTNYNPLMNNARMRRINNPYLLQKHLNSNKPKNKKERTKENKEKAAGKKEEEEEKDPYLIEYEMMKSYLKQNQNLYYDPQNPYGQWTTSKFIQVDEQPQNDVSNEPQTDGKGTELIENLNTNSKKHKENNSQNEQIEKKQIYHKKRTQNSDILIDDSLKIPKTKQQFSKKSESKSKSKSKSEPKSKSKSNNENKKLKITFKKRKVKNISFLKKK
ncbi:ww domain binding protein [Anaeramoeba ignava]|uniref:Ww domain binding protein n=1 Tax=Anaeramoeba ignava TaxID=1746090 RepID=A0A9Q0LLS7_ANAIG|nr:ww domain binding protein [Anaeramoeba ignava]